MAGTTPSPGIVTYPPWYDWDTIILNGIKTPGKAIVTTPPEPRSWTNNKGPALNGPVTRFAGNDVSTFDVTIIMWDPATQLAEYAALAPLFQRPSPGKQPPKISVVHPLLANAGIDTVVVTNHVGPARDMETWKGAFVAKISFQEWRPAIPMKPKPKDAIRAMDGPKSANDILEEGIEKRKKAIEAKTKQITEHK